MAGLEGKVALVTGGARGLGAAITRDLCAAGATVVCGDVRREMGEQLCAELGGRAEAIGLDVRDEASTRAAVQGAIERYGALDILVNNAGTDITMPIDEVSSAQWRNVVDVNLIGPFLMSKAAFPHMKQRGSGHIVNIASTASKRAWPNASAYHASKWGVLGLSHALHAEARPFGIKVTAIVTGGMRTPFLLDRFPDIDASTLQDPANVAQTVRFALTLPKETALPELMVMPMTETSWP